MITKVTSLLVCVFVLATVTGSLCYLQKVSQKTILYKIYDKCENVKLINHCINLYKQIVFINRGELLSLNLFKHKTLNDASQIKMAKWKRT